MKAVCDASSLISIVSTCFANSLKELVKTLGLELYISKTVYKECIERPITIKRYELSAVRLKQAVKQGWIKVFKEKLYDEMKRIQKTANKIYKINNRPLELVHEGEAESLALMKRLSAKIFIIDERTTRMIIESPEQLAVRLRKKYNAEVAINKKALREFNSMVGDIDILRSAELIALCFEHNLLALPKEPQSLEAALYAVKYAGCAVAGYEIDNYVSSIGETL
ncbi:hypothetical protein DRJ19_00285 [Candidatus Woesearchaeota archaeon]|nr:MAG: hypothetical protein DRJ19_00285 [Candidatus Woesearchaeota archaeon]